MAPVSLAPFFLVSLAIAALLAPTGIERRRARRRGTPRRGGVRFAALASLCLIAAAPSAMAADILDVLQRSQQVQLDALNAARVPDDLPAAATIRQSFELLLVTSGLPTETPLVVFQGPLLAVCLMGRVVAVNVGIAGMTESERLFILAHELGHVRGRHWDDVGRLYKRFIPDDVVRDHTDQIADALGHDAALLAHSQEFEADAFALHLLRRLGAGTDATIAVFHRLPMVRDTPTHPGTMERLERLQALASSD